MNKEIEKLLKEKEKIDKNIKRRERRKKEIDKLIEVLKNKKWKPKRGERYYYILSHSDVDNATYNDYNEVDRHSVLIGNYFKTKEEAKFEKEDAEKAIEKVGKDRIKKYYFGVGE